MGYCYFSLILLGNMRFAGGNMLGLFLIASIFLYITVIENRERIKNNIVSAVLISSGIVSIYSILQYYGLAGEFSRFKGTAQLPYATLGNRNYVADYLMLCLPFIVSGIERKRKLNIVLIVPVLLTLFLCGSGRTIVAMIAVFFIMSYFRKGVLRYTYLTIVIMILLGGLLIINVRGQTVIKTHVMPRFLIWKVTKDIIKDKPLLGTGIGTFEYYYPEFQKKYFRSNTDSRYKKYAQSPQRANNSYLHLISEQGVLGLVILILFFIWWYKKTGDKNNRYFHTILSALGGVSASAIFGFPFHRPSIILAAAVMMGSVISPSKQPKTYRDKLLVPAGILLVLSLCSFRIVEQISWEMGRRALEKKDYDRALSYIGTAESVSLLPGKLYMLHGRALYGKKRYRQALDYFDRSFLTYRHSHLYLNRGLTYLRLNMPEKALDDLVSSADIIPDLSTVRRTIVSVSKKLGKTDIAARYENMIEKP
ncbi:O-antigen ligase family protein [Elusimicrobiota bacterium]